MNGWDLPQDASEALGGPDVSVGTGGTSPTGLNGAEPVLAMSEDDVARIDAALVRIAEVLSEERVEARGLILGAALSAYSVAHADGDRWKEDALFSLAIGQGYDYARWVSQERPAWFMAEIDSARAWGEQRTVAAP